jgi:hypothetical protein
MGVIAFFGFREPRFQDYRDLRGLSSEIYGYRGFHFHVRHSVGTDGNANV